MEKEFQITNMNLNSAINIAQRIMSPLDGGIVRSPNLQMRPKLKRPAKRGKPRPSGRGSSHIRNTLSI